MAIGSNCITIGSNYTSFPQGSKTSFLYLIERSDNSHGRSIGYAYESLIVSSTLDHALFKRMVGSLMCLTVTRPNIMYGVSLISILMESPKESHWQVVKRILRYVSGTKDIGIMYSNLDTFKLIGYSDSDNGGNTNDRKSTSRYTFHFGTGVVSWDLKKQPNVTLSSTEAEYVATSVACQSLRSGEF